MKIGIIVNDDCFPRHGLKVGTLVYFSKTAYAFGSNFAFCLVLNQTYSSLDFDIPVEKRCLQLLN